MSCTQPLNGEALYKNVELLYKAGTIHYPKNLCKASSGLEIKLASRHTGIVHLSAEVNVVISALG